MAPLPLAREAKASREGEKSMNVEKRDDEMIDDGKASVGWLVINAIERVGLENWWNAARHPIYWKNAEEEVRSLNILHKKED